MTILLATPLSTIFDECASGFGEIGFVPITKDKYKLYRTLQSHYMVP